MLRFIGGNLTESIDIKSNESLAINKTIKDILDFGSDEVMSFFEAESSINFSIEATHHSF